MNGPDHPLDRRLGVTVGVLYPRYRELSVMAQNSGYDPVPSGGK
jgi:hypothetical protein